MGALRRRGARAAANEPHNWHEMQDDSGLLMLTEHGQNGSRWDWYLTGDQVWPILVRRDGARGRFAVAARPLSQGECVWSEEAYVHSVDADYEDRVCHECYREITAQDRWHHCCDFCGRSLFCSAACHAAGASNHAAECAVLRVIVERGDAADVRAAHGMRLLMRCLVQAAAYPSQFSEVEEQLQEHYSDAPPDVRSSLELLAHHVARLMPPSVQMEPSRVARLVSRLNANVIAIASADGVQLGSALYPQAASRFNHSCAPNAVVSFVGSRLRLHLLEPVAAGSEVTISYTELCEGRATRRGALLAAYAFSCRCSRCESPPARDADLDGWCCAAAGCAGGIVPQAQDTCVRCGSAHALPAASRDAIVRRWRETLEQGAVGLVQCPTAPSCAPEPAVDNASERARDAASKVLRESGGRLREDHALRLRARRLRVHALGALPCAPTELVDALEACVSDRERFRPRGHPAVAAYRRRLSSALFAHAAASGLDGNVSLAISLRDRARAIAIEAADDLAIGYGADHPTVSKWRRELDVT